MRGPALAVSALLAVALAGCGSTPRGPAASPAPSSPAARSIPAGGPVPAGLEKDPRVRAALRDAAGRVGIAPTTVVVAGYRAVTWNDGSLGCPREGQGYPQALVEGELLLLRADQRVMSYHSGAGGPFEYCARPADGYTPRS